MKIKTLLLITFALLVVAYVYAAGTLITTTEPATTTWTSTRTPVIAWSVDSNYTIGKCYIYSNSSGTWGSHSTEHSITNGTNYSTTVEQFNEGTVIWNIWCNMSNVTSGVTMNFTKTNSTLFVDVTDPAITINSPIDNVYFDILTLEINATVAENNVQFCDLYIDSSFDSKWGYTGGDANITQYNSSTNATSVEWYLSCNDTAGNSADSTERTAYLGGKPTISTTDPDNDSVNHSSNVYVSITPLGNSDDYTCYIWSNDSGTWERDGAHTFVNNNTATSILRHFTEGTFLWNAECFENGDRYPYVSSWLNGNDNMSLTVDTTNPSITINSPADNFYSNKDETLGEDGYNLNVTVTVTDSNADACTVRLDGLDNQTETYTTASALVILVNASPDTYDWSVICNDTAGNYYETTNRTVTLDKIEPWLDGIRNATIQVPSCMHFGAYLNFSEAVNATVWNGLTEDSRTYQNSSSTFLRNHTLNVTFNYDYETTQFINYTYCDRAANCVSNHTQIVSPVGLCSGWSIWSIYDAAINLTTLYDQTGAEFVYWWNRSDQSWLYHSSATTTYAENKIGLGEVIHLYDGTGRTWFRNYTSPVINKYNVNITSGHNFLGLYANYTFGNFSTTIFRNASGGNLTGLNSSVGDYEFRIDFFNSYNNSNQTYVSHIADWSWNNLTILGAYGNGLDTLHVYSDYNITMNISSDMAGSYVYMNWSN